MPHCIVEFSQNLSQEVPPMDMLEAVRDATMASELFTQEDIKLRALPYKDFLTAGTEDAFIHVTLRILAGRSQQQKQRLSQMVLDAIMAFALKDVSFTVEVCDMDRDTYCKKVVLSS
ncbi:5-carboxymethyl-2-hydroxymuconate Delta-isomerase [Marinomonas sp. THO17]|uniref:5-carboxymethyl-2-hydroxymuconate Delta-isomerase n=1 Tax=Marinomonas sp. THO17 TaxID=3149048 RepID=UPI00336BBA21